MYLIAGMNMLRTELWKILRPTSPAGLWVFTVHKTRECSLLDPVLTENRIARDSLESFVCSSNQSDYSSKIINNAVKFVFGPR